MKTVLMITAAALVSLAGCNKKSENPPPTPAATGSAAPAPAPAAGSGSAVPAPAAGSGSAAAAKVDVPTEQDFEEEATAKITDKNVESEVGALEKQLDPSKDTK